MKTPPDILYHGTARRFLSSIEEKGLLSQGRQYVHLSQDMETAYNVAKRHDKKPVILKIDAKQAWEDGVKFYYGNEKVWLANKIPSEYIIKDDTVISELRSKNPDILKSLYMLAFSTYEGFKEECE